MIWTAVWFWLLAALIGVGMAGMGLARQVRHSLAFFLLTQMAVGGLYALLGLNFLAAFQCAISVWWTAAAWSAARLPAHEPGMARSRGWPGVAVLSGLLMLGTLAWGIWNGRIGLPIFRSFAVWQTQTDNLTLLGQTLIADNGLSLALLGLPLLAGIVGAVRRLRSRPDEP